MPASGQEKGKAITVDEGAGEEELVVSEGGMTSPLGNVVCSGRPEVSTDIVGSVGVSDGPATVDMATGVLAIARDSVTVVTDVNCLVSVDWTNTTIR